MSLRELLDYEVYCPYSGMKIQGQTIPPHTVRLMKCNNGTLYGHCMLHDTRIFTRSAMMCSSVIAEAKVLYQIPEKRGRRSRNAEEERHDRA